MDQLGITSYGISVTTLEEVFLKVGHGIEDKDKEVVKHGVDATTKELDKYDTFSIAEAPRRWAVVAFVEQTCAILRRRVL